MDSVELVQWVERLQRGDAAALNELLRHVSDRLERLARHMLRAHPAVQRWAQTGDVLQGALVRLTRALSNVAPGSVRDFFALAAQQIRRELIDLARQAYGPQGHGANHASGSHPPDSPDRTHDPNNLAEWSDVHEQMELLPEDEREVVDLLFYQGLSQAEAASMLGVNVRTVQRRWHAALVRLHQKLADDSDPLTR